MKEEKKKKDMTGRKEGRKEGTQDPRICIVLSYFSVGTRIVWHRIIAFMANKRKDVPVRPGRCSSLPPQLLS
ncbi:hypothetical protein M0802_004616 [Mischocyttarus mexicanus]|nr:hypothetical protein M0802_004616 [Mischocyttarus mexicanus]